MSKPHVEVTNILWWTSLAFYQYGTKQALRGRRRFHEKAENEHTQHLINSLPDAPVRVARLRIALALKDLLTKRSDLSDVLRLLQPAHVPTVCNSTWRQGGTADQSGMRFHAGCAADMLRSRQ